MPLCARCFGAAIGHIASLAFFCIGILLPWWGCLAMMALLFLDWSLQEWLGIMSTNYRRLTTGILGAFGLGILWWRGVAFALGVIINH